jgi:hypothetical protein
MSGSAKDERARDGANAMRDYLQEQEATRAKTARLREQRLAHEALHGKPKPAVAKVAKAAKPGSAKASTKRTGKTAAGQSLANWLDDQEKSGRNT